MASEKNITMRQYNGVDYDTLYPKTIAEQVDGVYSKEESLTTATAALYGLPDTAVPDDVLALIKTLVDNAQTSANGKAKIQTGSYVGTGTYGASNPCSLTFDFIPKLVCIMGEDCVALYLPVLLNYIGVAYSSTSCLSNNVSISNKTISWYSNRWSNDSDAKAQLNIKNTTYYWLAIGSH